ncbi:MAG: hypothetical protein CL623_05470 [Arcobacter sp.]|nr:hypothetical protein [Arcobacter sp.]|tara:strand:- start:10247 stop:12790 length:2544 start_codon:yes stop_codon:yes gene_type:complete
MVKKINYSYRYIIAFIVLIGTITLYTVNYYKKSKELDFFNENILTLDLAYAASIDKYRLLTKYIIEESIHNESIISLFERGITSKEEVRRLYKGLLYRELYPLYVKLKENGIRQFQFHTKNNESYIRFHKPNKYGDDLSKLRESIRITNEENRIVTCFETGRTMSGFRNVFPITLNNKHLGSVEISISTKTMIDSISDLDKRREYSFILNKDIVFNKLFESQKYLYHSSLINSDFLVEDKNSSLPDSPKKLSETAKKINKKLHDNKEIKEAMENGQKYGVLVKLEDTYYDVTLIPLLGFNKKVEGYLLGYKESINLPFIIYLDMYVYLLIIVGMLVLITMLIIIQRKTKILENERKWFKSITDSLGEGLYVMDSNARINYINPVACKILGYKKEDILGKNAHSLFHSHTFNDNIKQEDCPIFCGVMKNKFFLSKKEYFLNSHGRNIPVSLNSTLVSSGNNDYEIVTSFSDISIQKELEDKSNLLIKALESSINCIVITNKNAIVEWANPAFEELTGFKIDEIIGKNPKSFISSKKQTKEFYSQMWNTILDKKPWKGELINKKKDGSLYDEELIITPVLDEDNEIVNFIAVKQDITHRKLLELEKEERDRLFFQQSKMAAMGEMLGNIAHQWRQPLSVISTIATGSKIQKDMNVLSDTDFKKAMDSINETVQYLSETIEDFRSFFDNKNNKEKEFLLSRTIDKALNIVSSQFVSKDIEIIKNLSEITILSSENEFIQVLLNILNNSKDALLKKENERKLIFIDAYINNNNIIIEIKDNAGGINEEIIDRIFEPYFTTKHQSQGTGIGLYMSQDIITKHLNGILSVVNDEYIYENTRYKGAKFCIEFQI